MDMRKLLLPFSFFYWIAIILRNWFFDIGFLKTRAVGVPVISVGNISTGGVGKTPVVEMLIEKFVARTTLAVVSRGYGRKSSGLLIVNDGKGLNASVGFAGDEPTQIATKYPNVIVVVDEHRVRGAQKAIELGAKMILLDDGFQHRYLLRNVNIVVLSADEILNGDVLLPAGNRREPLSSLERADILMISRCSGVEEFERAKNVLDRTLSFLARTQLVGTQIKLKSLRDRVNNQHIRKASISKKSAVIFSGIGNPKSFEALLENAGTTIAKHFVFSDHHWYLNAEIQEILEAKKTLKADFIITTEKDAARLGERFQGFLKDENLLITEIQQEIFSGNEEFDELVKRVIN
jgi:tetraacyldisaccharide 4'-kinase